MPLCYTFFSTGTITLRGAISNPSRCTTKPEWIQLVGRWSNSYYKTTESLHADD